MDTRMIEVALGLALVFALASLLVTAMQELYASARGTRGRVLQQAVQSFLGEDQRFAEDLMKSPLLVSLTKGSGAGRPSYMGADMLVTALIAMLVKHHTAGLRPTSPVQFIETLRALDEQRPRTGLPDLRKPGDRLPNAMLLDCMQSLLHGVENDWPGYQARLCAWYDSVTERSIGWFKRDNQRMLLLFGFVLAASLNINPIVIAPRLWQDGPLRQAMATAAQKAGDAYTTATAPAVASGPATRQPPDALVAPPSVSEDMRRATARLAAHEKETENQIHALKSVLETAMGALAQRPARPADRTWQSVPAAYEQLLALRAALDRSRQPHGSDALALREQLDIDAQIRKSLTALGNLAKAPGIDASATQPLFSPSPLFTTIATAVTDERAARASLATLQASATSPRRNDCTAATDTAAMPSAQDFCERLNDLNALKVAGLPIGWDAGAMPTIFASRCAAMSPTGGKTPTASSSTQDCWDMAKTGNLLLMIGGWLITAVAASLGAPFWFDLLSKVAKLRSAGARPSAADEAGTIATPPGGTTMAEPLGPNGSSGGGGGSRGGGGAAISEPMSDALNAEEKRLNSSEVRRVQGALGVPPAQVSGLFDGFTRQAIIDWKRANGYGNDAELSGRQIDELLTVKTADIGVGAIPPPAAPATPASAPSPDTPSSLSPPPSPPLFPLLSAIAGGGAPVPWDAIGQHRALATEMQKLLARIGLLDPPADGDFGMQSQWALHALLDAMGAENGREVDAALAALLLSDKAQGRFPRKPSATLAGRIADAMERNGFWLCRHPEAINIVYVEGLNPDGSANLNEPNAFNDLRTVLRIDAQGQPQLAGCWPASTEPGRTYTLAPLPGTLGVARIAPGQFKAWVIGKHKQTQPALVQVAPIWIYRDFNKNYRRDAGERVRIASTINQHGGYDQAMNNVGGASAGCLVGRTMAGHAEFMAMCERDPRYQVSHGYLFMTTVLAAGELGAVS